MTQLTPKNVLITGAAKRIGASCARLLHAQGYNVFIHCHLAIESASALCAELNAMRPNSAAMLSADLLQMPQLIDVAQQAQLAWGGIDVLINNASAFYPTDVAHTTIAQWDELFGTNVKAPYFLASTLYDTLSARRGCIINIIDIYAERGLAGYPVYSMAKAGLAAMTKCLAKEFGEQIRVNAVSPGAILWPEAPLLNNEKQDILARVVLGRCGTPEEIAKVVLFLVHDAQYMTGQILTVDGGRTLFC